MLHRPRTKRLCVALAATGLLTATAACGGDSGSGDDGKVTLNVSWWGEASRHKITEEAIDVFEKENPDITIKSSYSDWDAYYDQLTTKVAGGDAPDVFAIEIRKLGEFARNNTLANLKGLVNTGDLDQKLLSSGAVDGTQYAIPTGANAFAVMANPSVFEKAGVDVPDDTSWTWEDYQDVSAELTKAGGDGVYGTQINFNDAFLNVFAAQRGEPLYKDGKIGVSAGTLADWYKLSADMIKAKGSPDAALSNELGSNSIEQSLIGTNQGGMGMYWTNQLSAASTASGQEISLLQMPQEQGATSSGMFLQPTMFWAVGAQSKQQKAAGKLIDFLVNDPQAGKILGSDRGLPMNSKVLQEIKGDLPAPDQASLAYVDKVRDKLADPPSAYPDGAADIPDMLERYGQEVISGSKTPQDAAEGFLQEANSTLG
ncbi:extracellular solute-binding protein [Streptomyces sp. TRM70350]|uniref:ABC transporter substrate-binding protein n=1 Tax=Streptomyces sp. TRM70350 TaxID=2856165 RepID=UPI001C47C367|nr:extracellular solute-binding protein [Streptomyces sp. TRM70350]MBV7697186.1 extracellular solute-binding protein [Streptomyces sp. TRM70350]